MAHNSNPLFPRPDVLGDLTSLLGQRTSPNKPLSYGTAGFRAHAKYLHEAVFRCAILALCRSHSHDGLPIGMMITASHNPQHDNGVKLIEPDGSMFASEWEAAATKFITAPPQVALDTLSHLVDVVSVATKRIGQVLIGYDTRPSSPILADIAIQAISSLGGYAHDMGLLTTPQLHFCVRARTRGLENAAPPDYAATLRRYFTRLMPSHAPQPPKIIVDCSCGIGANALRDISLIFPAILVNCPGDGPLNDTCGTDFVQRNRTLPNVWTNSPGVSFNQAASTCLWASLDGDADRMIMFQPTQNDQIKLADGDRFAVLVAEFLSRHLSNADISNVRMAVAQTAYSNGAATEFLRTLPNVDVVIARTGVKHLEKAVRSYDIGIYWEPNGHGTVLFQDKTISLFEKAHERVANTNENQMKVKESLSLLLSVAGLANQAVGDGVADLLLVIAILQREGRTFEDLIKMYAERSSASAVVKVKNKEVITTSDFDRIVDQPIELRHAIEKIASGKGCRAFVRPSGTEDIVRVYAEAPAGEDERAKAIANDIHQAVFDICGGCE